MGKTVLQKGRSAGMPEKNFQGEVIIYNTNNYGNVHY